MAKLINILAASVGGGLVLGASIRLGEALGRGERNTADPGAVGPRLRRPVAEPGVRGTGPAPNAEVLPARLERPSLLNRARPGRTIEPGAVAETLDAAGHAAPALDEKPASDGSETSMPAGWEGALAGVVARIDQQQADVEAIRNQMSGATYALESVAGVAAELRGDLSRQLGEDLDQRLAIVEEKLRLSLKTSLETSQEETVHAMLSSIETRLAPRVNRLEKDVAVQTAALTELRECSMQSERSIQRLVGVLERVMTPRAGQNEAPSDDPRKLAVVPSRGQDEGSPTPSATLRPASYR